MLRKTTILAGGLGLILGLAAWAYAADEVKPAEQPKPRARGENGARAGRGGRGAAAGPQWQLAVMTYTFNQVTLFDAIDRAQKLGANAIETFAWEKISPKHGDMVLNADMPEPAIKEVQDKLAAAKIRMVGYYSDKLGKDEKADRKMFEFLKKFGVRYIVAEPDASALESVDKLAQEFKIRVAIHNHFKTDKNPEYKNWDPDNVVKMLEGRSHYLGCCADNGHWARSGLDGVEMIKKYKGRLISVHLKDVNKLGPDGHDVPYGTGVVKLKDLLAEIKTQGGWCTFSIEYENNMDDNVKDVGECITWFKKAKQELGVGDMGAGGRRGRGNRAAE